jgi:uncharacterized protein YcfL
VKRLAIALVLPAFLMVGCGENTQFSEDHGPDQIIPDTQSYVKRVNIEGRDCVIFRDGSMGGIWCSDSTGVTP